MTNLEKIKAMGIEEMAEDLGFYLDCGLCMKIFLESEVEEDEDN